MGHPGFGFVLRMSIPPPIRGEAAYGWGTHDAGSGTRWGNFDTLSTRPSRWEVGNRLCFFAALLPTLPLLFFLCLDG
jgi:hypothetical protein